MKQLIIKKKYIKFYQLKKFTLLINYEKKLPNIEILTVLNMVLGGWRSTGLANCYYCPYPDTVRFYTSHPTLVSATVEHSFWSTTALLISSFGWKIHLNRVWIFERKNCDDLYADLGCRMPKGCLCTEWQIAVFEHL